MTTINFDSTSVEPQQPLSSEPLPAGLYTVEITNAEVKELKSGNGTGLQLEFTVIDPEQFARRKVWSNLNIKHSSEQAEQIGQSQLSAICRAVKIGVLKDSDELFQRVLKIRTKVRPAEGQYAARTEVTGYEPAGTSKPIQQATQPAQAAAPAAKPWAKRAA